MIMLNDFVQSNSFLFGFEYWMIKINFFRQILIAEINLNCLCCLINNHNKTSKNMGSGSANAPFKCQTLQTVTKEGKSACD